MSRLRGAWRALADARGASIVEILLAATIFVMVSGAFGSMYLTGKKAFDYGTSAAYVQRQGTLIQEQIARWAKTSMAMQASLCGGTGTPGRSFVILDVNGTMRCIYQNPPGLNTDADLFVCQVSDWTGNCIAGTNYSMLNVMRSEVSVRLAAPLRVRNATFTRVACVDPGGSCGDNATGRNVTSALIDVRFDLTDRTIWNPRPADYVGMRFGFSITSRN